MKKRRNTKKRRRIVLIIKSSVLIIAFCIMFSFITEKTTFPTPSHPTNETARKTSSKSNIIPLHGLSQEGIPTGCESVSTVATLQYHGVNITIDEFINNFLPCQKFYRKGGMVYGANPQEYFAGDPYETASLGCYPNVILKALNEMKKSNYSGTDNLYFQDVSGADLNSLVTEYIDKQIPVILWITIDMKKPYAGMQYYLEDGSLYTWTAQEHCTVLCGYDDISYYIMDPLANGEIITYPKALVEQRYNELGKYALVITSSF